MRQANGTAWQTVSVGVGIVVAVLTFVLPTLYRVESRLRTEIERVESTLTVEINNVEEKVDELNLFLRNQGWQNRPMFQAAGHPLLNDRRTGNERTGDERTGDEKLECQSVWPVWPASDQLTERLIYNFYYCLSELELPPGFLSEREQEPSNSEQEGTEQ